MGFRPKQSKKIIKNEKVDKNIRNGKKICNLSMIKEYSQVPYLTF